MTPPAAAARDVRLTEIGQIAVPVKDVDRAVRFYRDTLGMPFLFQVPNMAFFQLGSVWLMLGIPEPGFDHPASVIYYQVDDIEAAHRTLLAREVKFIDAPHLVHRAPEYELWMTFFRDPDGNPLALMTRKPRIG
ncbi:MAG: VOC family protein [Gemmatimonadetes bacterium]|nr:VOC family protein [Gemmatimonadota bacterium]